MGVRFELFYFTLRKGDIKNVRRKRNILSGIFYSYE